MKRTIVLFVSAVFTVLAAVATAQDVGDFIVITSDDVALRTNGEIVGTLPSGTRLHVEETAGEKLRVVWRERRGWIERRETVPSGQALNYFDAAVRNEPNSDNLTARGVFHLSQAQSELALTDLNRAIRLDPRNAEAHLYRGTALLFIGERNQTMRAYGESIRLDPNNATAYLNRATILTGEGQHDQAIEDLNKAIRLDVRIVLHAELKVVDDVAAASPRRRARGRSSQEAGSAGCGRARIATRPPWARS